MPSYGYHIKFELYPSSNPLATCDSRGQSSAGDVWMPALGAAIFDDLPSHPRRRQYPHRPTPSIPRVAQCGIATSSTQLPTAGCLGSPGVINCGLSQSSVPDANEVRESLVLAGRQWLKREESLKSGFTAGIGPQTATKDWRFGKINIESFDSGGERPVGSRPGKQDSMKQTGSIATVPAASLGPNLGGMGTATKARYIPLETKNTEAGWGVVHLYRETDEVSALNTKLVENEMPSDDDSRGSEDENQGAILCIPAVPMYMSPSDFLGFMGEKWRGDVAHYRMIMTSRMNRYMVLMKFRDAERAREWRNEFDGKPFDSADPEICHTTFIKSITVETSGWPGSQSKGPQAGSPMAIHSLKPFPPPTPNLTELPTCTVCLERMDDAAGLMTILCQHVFHCTCLQTWKGTGCPVCRATNPVSGQGFQDRDEAYSHPFGSGITNLCAVCDEADDLWICLICGNVGCGRYRGGHAKDHWKETAHTFSLELTTQHVWDYAGDAWVHRLIREKGDGKVVEFPSNTVAPQRAQRSHASGSPNEDTVPRSKIDEMGMEYMQTLTSQLESQRVYFEDMVNKATDKAAKASAAAESASRQADQALQQLTSLKEDHRILKEEIVPSLERDVARERHRAAKSTDLARNMGKSLREEKEVSKGLMERIEHLEKDRETKAQELEELREMNCDLTMFISGQKKLGQLEREGKIEQAELQEGTVSVSGIQQKGKKKK